MQRFVFDLSIPADRLLTWYRGDTDEVVARDRSGRWVRFPTTALRPYVARGGVQGTFAVTVDENCRLRRIDRLS